MANIDSEDDEMEQRFRDLCLAVNMDKPTMELAWKSYETAKNNYSLDVSNNCAYFNTSNSFN